MFDVIFVYVSENADAQQAKYNIRYNADKELPFANSSRDV